MKRSALFHATHGGHVSVVKMLLEAKASANLADAYDQTRELSFSYSCL